MNIAEAKNQIKNAMQVYFAKDGYGRFLLPPEVQRPVFLMGPPGVGKTAVMKQIAGELGVGLVSYSMTHHTRQSALGLPVIVDKCYGGKSCKVSEYTMSEIIASVYDLMEETGVRQGILFLDEINCVSETLTPVMLQFLQYKTLGRHRIPDGWIVVTAGNPPEYNRSAREFDTVIWDRLKRIDIEPDYGAFREYAVKKGMHPAVLTYLDAKKAHFYRMENSPEGRRFVTARGWDDLSDMITLYEQMNIPVDEQLVSQYVQDGEIAEDFAVYYELFNKYRADYRIGDILAGNAPADIRSRAEASGFDERLSLLGLILSRANADMKAVCEDEEMLKSLRDILRRIKTGAAVETELAAEEDSLARALKRGGLSAELQRRSDRVCEFLRREGTGGFAHMSEAYMERVAAMKADAARTVQELENIFAFCEQVWREGQELLVLVTELTAGWYSARFISRFGCAAYYRHSDELKFYERHTAILSSIERLEEQEL